MDTRIYKTDVQYWTVLGSRGGREREKKQTTISFFLCFQGQIFFRNIAAVRTKKLRIIKLKNLSYQRIKPQQMSIEHSISPFQGPCRGDLAKTEMS